MTSLSFPDDPHYGTFLKTASDASFLAPVLPHLSLFDQVVHWDGTAHEPLALSDALCQAAVSDSLEETWGSPQDVGNGTVLETRQHASGCNVYRIRKTMDGAKEAILSHVTRAESLGAMDHTVRVLQPVRVYDGRTRLVYNVTRVGPIFKDRDFFDLACEREFGKGKEKVLVSAAVSVPGTIPEMPNLIRGWTMRWAVVLKDGKEKGKTDLTLICQANINGWMPRSLANMATGKVIAKNYIGALEQILSKK